MDKDILSLASNNWFLWAFLLLIGFLVLVRLPWVWWWNVVHNFYELQLKGIDAEERKSQQRDLANYKEDPWSHKRKQTKLVVYSIACFICFVYCITVAAVVFNIRFDREYEGIGAWGPVGDFFGGMLNPILAFASFIALLYTIRIQSEELRLTREEFSKSVDAQERLAKEAENGLNRQLCFEDYAHVIKRFRGEIGALNRLRRESIPKADFPRSSNPPKSINNLVQQISLNFMATAKGESENAESCFDRAYQKYNPFAPEDKNIFYEVVAEKINQFLMDAIALKNSLKIYKTCCKKIVQNDVQSMIREDDIRSALSILAFAYIVSRIFKTPDSKYYYSYYKPTESDDLKMFKEILGNFGLPTKALETL